MNTQQESWLGPVQDEFTQLPVTGSRTRFEGRVWDIKTDDVEFESGVTARDYMVHTGAVAVVALNDSNQIYLLRQYRHPVAMSLFELPAGLLDVPDENALHTAQRELAEEAGLIADNWDLITDFFTSPGGSSEAIRLYLARGIQERPGGRDLTGEAEEMSLPGVWLDLDEAVSLVLSGSISNAIAVIGILSVAAVKAKDWQGLRPADLPWPARDELIKLDHVRIGRFEK